jgi:RNA polymerase sigma factor (sigma-70 family)
MDPAERAKAEADIRGACEAEEYDRATTAALDLYGSEVLAWLIDRLGNPTDASDVFSILAEDFWKSLDGFQWRCSARTWLYLLGRRAAGRFGEARNRDRRRQVPLSRSKSIAAAIERARTSTAPYRRTSVKDRFRELRAKLPTDDRTLLILRVDRQLQWADIAVVFLEDPAADDETVRRESAKLRKRFGAVKKRLKELATAEGLVGQEP